MGLCVSDHSDSSSDTVDRSINNSSSSDDSDSENEPLIRLARPGSGVNPIVISDDEDDESRTMAQLVRRRVLSGIKKKLNIRGKNRFRSVLLLKNYKKMHGFSCLPSSRRIIPKATSSYLTCYSSGDDDDDSLPDLD